MMTHLIYEMKNYDPKTPPTHSCPAAVWISNWKCVWWLFGRHSLVGSEPINTKHREVPPKWAGTVVLLLFQWIQFIQKSPSSCLKSVHFFVVMNTERYLETFYNYTELTLIGGKNILSLFCSVDHKRHF